MYVSDLPLTAEGGSKNGRNTSGQREESPNDRLMAIDGSQDRYIRDTDTNKDDGVAAGEREGKERTRPGYC